MLFEEFTKHVFKDEKKIFLKNIGKWLNRKRPATYRLPEANFISWNKQIVQYTSLQLEIGEYKHRKTQISVQKTYCQ